MTLVDSREGTAFRGPYGLNEDEDLFRRTVHEFAEREIVPIAHELDEREEFPRASVGKMADLGLMGLLVPEEYGGAGADTMSYALAMEEISWADASHSVVMSVNNSLVCEPIVRFGNREQKERFLPALAQGRYVGAYCLTEPESGSDASNMSTRAEQLGDDFILNGTKAWITNGGEAGVYLVYALTNTGVARARGITAFLIPADTQGLRAGAKEKKLGIRASSTTQIFFEDCHVPASAVLGNVDEGFRIAMATLDGGRIGIGAQALGIAQRALDESVRYSKERAAFGHAIADFQGLQWRMADMATRIEAARLLVYRAARMKDAGQPFSKEASMAKLFASETAMFCAHAAVQNFGGNGFSREYPVEKLFRDAKITEIYEGTSEIQRLVISRHLLRG
ncbi:MAG: acyl-CoA dehydrogenase [Chloroflexi bacterium]|nr:acyl-CoA dehydrogenase [Chloroflexota bacterium]MBV9598040.1 acyl-CoA dehydrogenase [Chloroflexota bacterium]